MHRSKTIKIKIGKNCFIGGSNKVLIQSMCNIKTSKINLVSKQINNCYNIGADIMRISILDKKDALAIKEIKKKTKIPLVADIHFNYELAIMAIDNGIDAIRINPDNLDIEKIKLIIEKCKNKKIPIRIGMNSGSYKEKKLSVNNLIKKVQMYVDLFEKNNFYNIIISLKSSNVKDTIEAYRLASKKFKYPLHIGLTESGPKDIGIIKSVAALSPLLYDGIGNTIRISLSDDPIKEIVICKRLLNTLNLYKNYPNLISCPTCGRTISKNFFNLTNKIWKYLEKNNLNIKIAVMGCNVNGYGEIKNCDYGLLASNKNWIIYKNGKILKQKVNANIIYKTLINLLSSNIKFK